MALTREVYRALEDIVGPENISEDAGVLDVYAFSPWNIQFAGEQYLSHGGAVIVPGSTEEVQAIVRACNRYKIKFHAHSTGWAMMGLGSWDDIVILDLRRMNRILEINEEDMYVVVEPYVCWSELQAELFKRGYNTSPIEAGSQCSALASCTSVMGAGSKSVSLGFNGRNLLGLEWVLPTGDILRLGSLGSGGGWFCGDGPGPSLRGILRGMFGAMGGIGVSTKCGMKIGHWPFKDVSPTGWFPLKGQSPTYTPELPKNRVKTYFLEWPTFEQWAEGQRKLATAEVMSEFMRGSVSMALAYIMRSNQEYRKTYPGMKAIITGHCSIAVIEADTEEEFEYKTKVIDKILEETEGYDSPLFHEDWMQRAATAGVIRTDGPTRCVYRIGTFCSSFWPLGSFYLQRVVTDTGTELKKKYIARGSFMDDGADNAWGIIYEHGHYCHLEELFLFDPAEPSSSDAFPYTMETMKAIVDQHIAGSPYGMGWMTAILGPHQCDFHNWERKIKKALDPNEASDPSSYISGEE